ncbi:MAG: hypothetical protein GX958_00490 [Desulfitobacterium sp.]|nr:hypothetical protein [Desulfitobacterium sp.]
MGKVRGCGSIGNILDENIDSGAKICIGKEPPEIELQKALENFVREVERSLEY